MTNKISGRRSMPRFSLHIRSHEVKLIEQLQSQQIDHVLLPRENEKVYLMIHGCDKGVGYNGFLINFEQLSKLIRLELNLKDTEYLNLGVFCCYALYQKEYTDENNRISCVFDNKRELNFQLDYNNKTCNFFVA